MSQRTKEHGQHPERVTTEEEAEPVRMKEGASRPSRDKSLKDQGQVGQRSKEREEQNFAPNFVGAPLEAQEG